MLTVLFVVVFLGASVGALSLLDGQRASREVTSYLHEEYHMARYYQPTVAHMRNMKASNLLLSTHVGEFFCCIKICLSRGRALRAPTTGFCFCNQFAFFAQVCYHNKKDFFFRKEFCLCPIFPA